MAEGRSVLTTAPATRFTLLALLQVVFAVGALAYATFPPAAGLNRGLDLVLALALGLLALVAIALLPRLPVPVYDAAIALTWLVLAVIVGTRVTAEGQVVMTLSVLLMAVYVSYSRPRRLAVAHLVGMGVAFGIALAVNNRQSSPFFLLWTVVTLAVTAWVVMTLRERDRHLAMILENSADVVFHTRDGVFQWVSPSSLDVLGWHWSDLVGTRKLDLWHPDDRPRALASRVRTASGEISRETMRLRRPDGEYLWVEATLRPYVDAYGFPGIAGSMRDVSDRVAAQQALQDSELEQRALAARLAAAIETRTRLIQNISHEFRTPLTVMRAPLQRLARHADALDEQDRAEVDAALRGSRRLARLVDDLIDVARADSGTAVTAHEIVDVATVTSEAVELFRPACDDAGIALTVSVDDVPTPLWLDRDAWAHVVTNLVSNAVRFTDAGRIDVTLDYDEPWLSVAVVDTGVGVDPAEREHIFERFQQGSRRAVRGGGGTGIGLAVVRDLARDLGGDCGMDGGPDGGTRVWVRVRAPRARPASADAARGDGRPEGWGVSA